MSPRAASLGRLGVATAGWLAIVQLLPPFLRRHAPMALQRVLSEAAYLAAVELLDLALGLGLVFLLVPEARRVLALGAPRGRAVLIGALLVPLLSAVTSAIALTVAMPWLLDEVASRGEHASRENAGALGRVLTTAPLFATILFGSVLAAAGEELLFRGALFGFLKEIAAAPVTAPDAHVPADLAPRRFVLLREAILPTLGAALVFSLLHADMAGAVGIVRVVSTALLAIACGAARHASGSIVVPLVMHLLYNLVAIAQVRGLVAAISPATWGYVPAPVVVLGLIGAALAFVVGRVKRA